MCDVTMEAIATERMPTTLLGTKVIVMKETKMGPTALWTAMLGMGQQLYG